MIENICDASMRDRFTVLSVILDWSALVLSTLLKFSKVNREEAFRRVALKSVLLRIRDRIMLELKMLEFPEMLALEKVWVRLLERVVVLYTCAEVSMLKMMEELAVLDPRAFV